MGGVKFITQLIIVLSVAMVVFISTKSVIQNDSIRVFVAAAAAIVVTVLLTVFRI